MFRILILLVYFFSTLVNASVVINSTRVIYYEKEKEVSVKLMNKSEKPVLIQSWIDDGDSKKSIEDISVPFVLTPPINRVDGGKGQTLRIINTEPLSKDKESVFWLNVLEIPAIDPAMQGKNYMQMAFRTRIKLFYRPDFLSMTQEEALSKMTFKAKGKGIEVSNPGPYYFNTSNIELYVNDKKYLSDGVMISPEDNNLFVFNDLNKVPSGAKLVINYINDYGAIKSINKTVGLK